MVLMDKDTNWIDLYNSEKNESIIVATEMILAHKIFNNTNKTVIGISNNIDKEWILNIVKRMNASKIVIYADKYTLLYTSSSIYEKIIPALEEKNVEVDFRIALTENSIGKELREFEKKKKIA